jgi:putative DNA primase/helicase
VTNDSAPLDALAALLRQHFPLALRERAQWLLWRFEPDPERPDKPRKVPYYVGGSKRYGKQGSDADRERLVALEGALARLARGGFDGVGFAFLPGDGLVGIDIDGAIDEHGEVSARCQAIIAACGSYTELSPSGRGVHIVVSGDIKSFKDNRIGIEVFCGRQFFTCTGRHWPGAPLEVAPLQEGTLRRLQATVARSKGAARLAVPAQPSTIGNKVAWLEQALGVLDAGGVSYDEWIGVGMALKSELGDSGLGLWDYWSSKGGDRYPGAHKLETHWKSFPGTDVDGALTIFKMARKGNRWRPPRAWFDVYGGKPAREQAATAAAPAAKELSTPSRGSAEEAEEGAAQPAVGDDEGWRAGLLRSNNGLKDCRENVYLCLVRHPTLKGLVGYDEFSHRVMKLRAPPWDSPAGEWTTNDDYKLGYWLATKINLVVKGDGTLVAGVAMAAYDGRFHPVHAFLNALPAWDGVERLRHWLHECLGAEDNEYAALVGAWFLMGMVQRVLHPGCQMDYMVVLEGLQGKRKSTALRTLVGRDEWFADTPIRLGYKDALLTLAGIWLYEVSELDSFNKAEVTAVKIYVSSRVDRVREPFARRMADRPRSSVFAGSTNQSEYFKDPTGARRFWPVACDGEIDLAKLAQWREQLFAEVMARLNHADQDQRRYYPTREETDKYLVPQQERREIVDPWFERIATWLDSSQNYGDGGLMVREVDNFTTHDLLTKALNVPIDRIDGGRQMSTRVGIAMHKLQWIKKRDPEETKGTGPKPTRLWRYWRPTKPSGAAPAQGSAAPAPEEETVSEF